MTYTTRSIAAANSPLSNNQSDAQTESWWMEDLQSRT